MAKKKKSAAVLAPEAVEVKPEEIAQAKALLEDLGRDIAYKNAKALFKRKLGMASSVANAVVVALYNENFEKGDHNWFCHPDAKTGTAVVNGARTASRMTMTGVTPLEFEAPVGGGRLPGDLLAVRDSTEGWRVAGLIKRRSKWICRFQAFTGTRAEFRPISVFSPVVIYVDRAALPENFDKTSAAELELDQASMEKPDLWDWQVEGPAATARYVKPVGKLSDPLGEQAIASAEHGVPVDFSPEALEEAAALPDKVDGRSMLHRVDLTDLAFVTIDGEDSRDFDDAVYCEETPSGWRLLVAIADVSNYVKPGSALDEDAQRRGTSVYFPASVIPMLPEKLSNGLCSLNPNVDRLVLVCDALVNKAGATTAYQFYPAVIHSHARLTYTQVWSALQGEADGLDALGPRIADIRHLYDLYKALRAARVKRGALDFETTESMARFDDAGHIAGFVVRDHNDAHRLIEECMLVANVCAAQFVIAKKQQTLFRCHAAPQADRIQALRATLRPFGIKLESEDAAGYEKIIEETKDKPFLQTAVLRSMSRACYQPQNIGHFGLQFEAYAHFTSPIRRYPDLLLHRTIKGILAKKPYSPKIAFDPADIMAGYHARKLMSEAAKAEAGRLAKAEAGTGRAKQPSARQLEKLEAWKRLGYICSAAERRADDATRDVMQYLKCDFLARTKKRNWRATVTGMCAAGVYITLDEMPIEGFIHISKLGWGYYDYDAEQMTMTSYDEMVQVRLGDPIEARLESVNAEERRIDFALVHDLTQHKVKGRGRGRPRRTRSWESGGDDFDDDRW